MLELRSIYLGTLRLGHDLGVQDVEKPGLRSAATLRPSVPCGVLPRAAPN